MTDLSTWGVVACADAVRSGRLSAVALAPAALDRIAARHPGRWRAGVRRVWRVAGACGGRAARTFWYESCSALTQRTISSMLRPTHAG